MGCRRFNFIRIVLHSVIRNEFVLFSAFVPKNIRMRIQKSASLETPTGLSWIVEVGEAATGRPFFFGYGWMDFMEHHFDRYGNTILFRYAGGSKFLVGIFDRKGTEIVYPSAAILTEVQNNGIVRASAKIKSTIMECGVSDHGVAFFRKELSESAVSGRQLVAIPASLLKDNKLILNNKYKSCLVELPVGGRVRSGLSWKRVRNGLKCSRLGGWKNFCHKCQPKKGDVVSIFLDFDDRENIPVFRISFDGEDFDFIRQVKTEVC
ncbi:hypothetical protein ACFE04_019494 [Oxalis oulophora]